MSMLAANTHCALTSQFLQLISSATEHALQAASRIVCAILQVEQVAQRGTVQKAGSRQRSPSLSYIPNCIPQNETNFFWQKSIVVSKYRNGTSDYLDIADTMMCLADQLLLLYNLIIKMELFVTFSCVCLSLRHTQ